MPLKLKMIKKYEKFKYLPAHTPRYVITLSNYCLIFRYMLLCRVCLGSANQTCSDDFSNDKYFVEVRHNARSMRNTIYRVKTANQVSCSKLQHSIFSNSLTSSIVSQLFSHDLKIKFQLILIITARTLMFYLNIRYFKILSYPTHDLK